MKFNSFLRFFGQSWLGNKAKRRGPQRHRKAQARLEVERLESRELLAADIPTIASTTPLDASNPLKAPAFLLVTFSEEMQDTGAFRADDKSKYVLLNSAGVSIPFASAAFTDGSHTTVKLVPSVQLSVDTYSLFVRGDKVQDKDDGFALAQPGQLIAANAGRNNVAVGGLPGNGAIGAPGVYDQGALSRPYAAGSGDLDGDGLADLVLVNAGDNEVVIYQGRPVAQGGGFNFTSDLTLFLPGGTANLAKALVVADLNGDGKADLAVGNSNTNNVSVFLNTNTTTGTLSFGIRTDLAASGPVIDLVAGHLNNDTNIDLVAAVSTAPGDLNGDAVNDFRVDVFRGTGSGAFGASQTFRVGDASSGINNPTGVAVGQFNAAAGLDIAVGGANGVAILSNTTAAPPASPITFAAPGARISTNNVISLVAASVDAGSTDDLVAGVTFGGTSRVEVLRNLNGTFSSTTADAGPGLSPARAISADLNNDGRNDFLITNGAGNGGFTSLVNRFFGGTVSGASNSSPITITSANHGLTTGQQVQVTGVGGNTTANNPPGANWVVTVPTGAIGSANATGPGPIVITSAAHGLTTGTRVTITGSTLDAANGTFTITLDASDPTNKFTLNGTTSVPDGTGSSGSWTATDLFSLDGSTGIAAYTGGGTWALSSAITTATGDGVTDVVVTSPGHGLRTGDRVAIQGSTFAAFNSTFTITLDATDPANKFTLNTTSGAAFNGTGIGGIWVLQGSMVAAANGFAGVDANPVGITVLDSNQDGNLDVVTANRGGDNATLVIGSGDGSFLTTFNSPAAGALPGTVRELAVGDINKDGFRDIVTINNAATTAATQVTVQPGLGNGTYGAPINFSPAFPGRNMRTLVGLTLEDINGDGYLDVLVANKSDSSVGILLNKMTGGIVSAAATAGGLITITTNGAHGLATGNEVTITGSPFGAANGTFTITVIGGSSSTQFTLDGTAATGSGFGGTWSTKSFGVNSLRAIRDIAVGDGPNYIATGDINEDGKMDMAVSHYAPLGTHGVSIRLGNGDGTFTTPSFGEGAAGEWFTGTYGDLRSVMLVDFDNDQNLDIVVLEDFLPSGYVDTRTGLGNGNFNFVPDRFLGVNNPSSFASGDFNRDGFVDVALTTYPESDFSGGISIVLNQAGTAWGVPQQIVVTPLSDNTGLEDIVVADLNGDNIEDLIVSATGAGDTDNNVFVLMGVGDGTFGQAVPYFQGQFQPGGAPPLVTPTYLAITPQPLVLASTFEVGVNLINNGDFESPTLFGQLGTVLGWTTFNLVESTLGSNGGWRGQTGTNSPLSGTPVGAPTGTYRAMLDQANENPLNPTDPDDPFYFNGNSPTSYAGTHVLYQDIVLPRIGSAITGASNAGPIVITSATPHGLSNGGQVQVFGVEGNTAANSAPNSTWFVKTTGFAPNQFALYTDAALTTPVVGDGDYTGEGGWRLPFTELTLTLNLFLDNRDSGVWTDPNTYPDLPLDYRENPGSPQNDIPGDNQQVRIDILDPTKINDPTERAPTAELLRRGALLGVTDQSANPEGAVLLNVFRTDPGTTNFGTIAITADLTALGGRTVRLAIRTTNNKGRVDFGFLAGGRLIVGVDDVEVKTQLDDPLAPTLSGVKLRNPGFLGNPNNTPHTNDPTIVGEVADNSGLDGLKYVEIDVKNDGFKSDGKGGNDDVRIVDWDASGAFAVTLPTANAAQGIVGVVPGLNTVRVRVVDSAGNTSTAVPLTFFMQSGTKAVSEWEAVGPQSIDVAIKGIDYTKVSGRVTAVAPDMSDPTGNTYYIGSANGGVWKTTNGGSDWTPSTTSLSVPAPVSSMVQHFDPQTGQAVLYAATGLADRSLGSRPGIGVLKSTDGGRNWQILGAGALAGARISKIVVNQNNPDIVYVAVASGGDSGPGVYRSIDGGVSWRNLMDQSDPNVRLQTSNFGFPVQISGPLGSVTDIAIDPNDPSRIIVGMGNIGLVGLDQNGTADPDSAMAGMWFANIQEGQSSFVWTRQTGGQTAAVNDTLPSGTSVGRMTVAIGGRPGNEAMVYVLIGNRPGFNNPPFVDYGDFGNNGTTEVAGLYKTKDNFQGWTKVMLRQDIGFGFYDDGTTFQLRDGSHQFVDINLFGHDAANVGSMVVDPNNPNALYIGGSRRWGNAGDLARSRPDPAGFFRIVDVNHSFIYVDTGGMRDTTFQGGAFNDGDSISKAGLDPAIQKFYDAGESNPDTANQDAYTGEGVFWYDLETGASHGTGAISGFDGSAIPSALRLLPPAITALAFDPIGRLIVGTANGVWSGTPLGFGHDVTSGGTGINGNFEIYSTPGVALTSINGNLQISDMTSVAIDPLNPGTYYTTQIDSGTAGSNSPLTWRSQGLSFNSTGFLLDPGIGSAGVVLTANPPPGSDEPVTLFRVWRYADGGALRPERSNDGGQTWVTLPFNGLPTNSPQAAIFPPLAINTTPVRNGILDASELVLGTTRVFLTRTNGNVWDPISGDLGSPITALQIAPSKFGFITTASNAPKITITSANHRLKTGDKVRVYNVEGNTAANGNFWVKVLNANQFQIFRNAGLTNAVSGNGNHTAGTGIWTVADAGVYYAGTQNGQVWVADDGPNSFVDRSGGLPTGKINGITVDPDDQSVAYVMIDTIAGGGAHVWKTANFGQTWTNISTGLGNVPAHALVIDKAESLGAPNGKLYVGTDNGVFVSIDGGNTWKPLDDGMPNVAVIDLQFDPDLKVLAAATLGRGVFTIQTNVISQIDNLVIDEDQNLVIPFSINDQGLPKGSYTVTVKSTGSNPNDLFTHASSILKISGTGADRTLTLKPKAETAGTSTITITVKQGNKTWTESFQVTVNTVNDTPMVTTASSVTRATNQKNKPIVITSANHGLKTGDVVRVSGVKTATKANGSWTVTVVSESQFRLDGSKGTGGAAGTGGTWKLDGFRAIKVPVGGNSGFIPFTLSDPDQADLNLVTITAMSDDPSIIADSGINNGIEFTGSGANRFFRITPLAGQSGEVFITITLTDSGAPSGVSTYVLPVLVTGNASLPFNSSTAGRASDFNKGNSTFLGRGWSEKAGNFDRISFDGASNKLTAGPSKNNVATLDGVSALNARAQALVSVIAGQKAAVLVRYQSASGNYYAGQVEGLGNGSFRLSLIKKVGSTTTVLASQTVTSGTGTLQLEVVNNQLTLGFNGVTLNDTDGSISLAGSVGLFAAGAAIFDDFVADAL